MNEYDDAWLLHALFEEEYKHLNRCTWPACGCADGYCQEWSDTDESAQALDYAGNIMPAEEQASEEPSEAGARKVFKFSL